MHAEQQSEKLKIVSLLRSNGCDCSILSDYQKQLFYSRSELVVSYINLLYSNFKDFSAEVVAKHLSFSTEDVQLWFRLEKEQDSAWSLLKFLTYACSNIEYSAQNKGKKICDKIVRAYLNNSGYIVDVSTTADNTIHVLQKLGYDIDINQKENFAQMNNIAHLVRDKSVFFEILQYLLDVYKNKKIDKPFVENYKQLENLGFKSLVKIVVKQFSDTYGDTPIC